MFKYFDAHSHLNLEQFDLDRAEQIKKLEENNIGTITIGVDKATSGMAVELAQKSDNLYAGIGLHPTDTDEDFDADYFEDLIKNPKVVCVGECGLDFFRLEHFAAKGSSGGQNEASARGRKTPGGSVAEEKARQKEIFIKQIELALKYKKPLMLHCRPSKGTQDAYEDTLDILEKLDFKGSLKSNFLLRGNAHFFVGDLKIAKRFLALNFTLSFPGIITFARDYDEVIKFLPLQNILSETDAPFATPVPYRGKRNESSYVIEIVKKIAEIRGEEYEKVRIAMIENAKKLFKL
ncbi:MAG TPA: TatD family hydrolase [Candidatus Paceibacterota bacterium]